MSYEAACVLEEARKTCCSLKDAARRGALLQMADLLDEALVSRSRSPVAIQFVHTFQICVRENRSIELVRRVNAVLEGWMNESATEEIASLLALASRNNASFWFRAAGGPGYSISSATVAKQFAVDLTFREIDISAVQRAVDAIDLNNDGIVDVTDFAIAVNTDYLIWMEDRLARSCSHTGLVDRGVHPKSSTARSTCKGMGARLESLRFQTRSALAATKPVVQYREYSFNKSNHLCATS